MLSLVLICLWGIWHLRVRDLAAAWMAPPLPVYALEIHPPDHGPLRMSSTLSLVLRPQERVKGPLEVHAFLELHGRLCPWDIQLASSPSGTLRLRSPLAELTGLSPGHWAIIFVIDRPGHLQDRQVIQGALDIQDPL